MAIWKMFEATECDATTALKTSWLAVGVTLIVIALMVGLCYYRIIPFSHWQEEQRILIRTLGYITGIVLLPLTNLLRFVLLRLCQTMPLSETQTKITAQTRYAVAISRYFKLNVLTLSLMMMISLLGVGLYSVGDALNTLVILTGMACLGIYLYRPKATEFIAIAEELAEQGK
ncbi:hypothetical protein [Methylocucumis oryzae]|uniref:hypothetical protein n=1 Tax=Methylocucumis oryzae TaxID=1632867 RepID=UPI0010407344|nr:hypothetical protein [Methylocucumis oryzae]